MKESLIADDKRFLNDLFENLIFEWTISAIEVKQLLKLLAIENESLIYFSSLVNNERVSLVFICFIATNVFITFQLFPTLIYIFDVVLLRSTDKRFL